MNGILEILTLNTIAIYKKKFQNLVPIQEIHHNDLDFKYLNRNWKLLLIILKLPISNVLNTHPQ